MKKFLFMYAICAMLCIHMSSCSNDDNLENESQTENDNLPPAIKQFVGYWINTHGNNYGIDLFLNTDGTGTVTSYSWYWNGKGNYGYTIDYDFIYWNYDEESKCLATSFGAWQFTVTMINEEAMAARRLSGNSNVLSQSWYKADNLTVAKYLLEGTNWYDENGEIVTFDNFRISEDDDITDMTFNYSCNDGIGTFTINEPYTPKKLTIDFTGAYEKKVYKTLD